ncbi:MAG TPA: hypothetical protein VJR26_01440 [Candidatus Acidoferrales bacterium]|nr:hypothetical protein [Candidatus Acidoferrales bacterium]
MIELGIVITAATAAALVIGFLRSLRQRPLPAYGWLGIAALALAEWLMFHRIEPVWTYFTPIAWTAYIVIADAAVFSMTGRSRLHDAPVAVAQMALLSIPLWLVFEGYNWHLENWTYVGAPAGWTAIVFGYGWSFATITPAIFETADLVQAMMPTLPGGPVKFSRAAEDTLIVAGALSLILPLVLPLRIAARLFALVWIGFVLLLDPLNRRLDLPSFIGDLSEGFRRRLYGFLAAGWICGWFWEFWNNWAGAKWHYTFPMFQDIKIFEMPAPGFLGFLPFALECFTMYVTVAGTIGWIKRIR